ncbi:MAG: class I SAM-dependent methyltransferase [Chthoniobacterales bacterium]
MDVDAGILEKVYQENYFKGEEYLDYARDKHVLQRNFDRRLSYLASFTNFAADTQAIEIGCAYGFFGEVLRRKFPALAYLGFDVVPEACEHAVRHLGLNVQCADFLEVDPVPRAQHVFMWDVIEHLQNPQHYLEKIGKTLESAGRVYITTGDISAALPRLQRHRWRMIHPPSHLHYFSRRSLEQLLRRYGFRVLKIRYPSTARSLKQIYYSLFMLKRHGRPLHALVHRTIPEEAFVSLNTFDIMLAVAEKQ